MNTDEIDELAWHIMLHNEEYSDMDRMFALNGVLRDSFDDLTSEEQEDLIKRLAIGIQSFNAEAKEAADKVGNWRKLPKVEVSGNDES